MNVAAAQPRRARCVVRGASVAYTRAITLVFVSLYMRTRALLYYREIALAGRFRFAKLVWIVGFRKCDLLMA